MTDVLPRRHGLTLALFLFLLAVYLTTYSPRFHSSDGLAMFSAAESLARRGDWGIDQIQWMGLQQGTYGLDGHLYSRKGPGMSLLMLPLTWLGLTIPGWGAASTTLLFNSLITAATAVGLFWLLRRLDFGDNISLIAALCFGLATLAWPYAKTAFSDPLAGLCLLVTLLVLLRFRHTGAARFAFLAGAALAVSVATRYANALLILPFAALFLVYAWSLFAVAPQPGAGTPWRRLLNSRRGFWPAVLAFGLPLILAAILLAWYNFSRYGNPLSTGYLAEESFSGNWWQGIVGMLFSPGRGLFLYAPILLVALPSFPAALRRFPAEAGLALAVIVFHLLLYGKWFMWHGGYAWGPRFIVPAIPFFVLLMAPGLKWLLVGRRRYLLVGLFALSLVPQLLGLSVHFELFQNSLLDTGLPLFAPQTFFLPQYSPLAGQWAYLQVTNLDFAWINNGRVDWLMLACLLAAVAVSAAVLAYAAHAGGTRKGRAVACALDLALLLLAGAVLLSRTTHAYPADLQQVTRTLNASSTRQDAIVTGSPAEAVDFADLYRGGAYVLGLNAGSLSADSRSEAALQTAIDRYARIWWLTPWVSHNLTDIETQLSAGGYRVSDQFFPRQAGSDQGRRLVLFYFPKRPMTASDLAATFGDRVRLESLEMQAGPYDAGDVVALTLIWQAVAPVPYDTRTFVQLIDAGGNRVAGSDQQPSLEPDGQLVEDRHAFQIPAGLPAGDYRLIAGLYQAADGVRLLQADGSDYATLAIIQID